MKRTVLAAAVCGLAFVTVGLGPRPELPLVLRDAMNGGGRPGRTFISSRAGPAGTQVMGLGPFEIRVPGDPTVQIGDLSFDGTPRPPFGDLDLSGFFPELPGTSAGAGTSRATSEIKRTANRLGITPEALAFNRGLERHLANEVDNLTGPRDASGNLLRDDVPVADVTAGGLAYIRDGAALQFDKQAAQLRAIRALPDADRLSMASDLLREAEVVHDAYVNMIGNEPVNFTRSETRVDRRAEYESLLRRADAAAGAGNVAEADRLRSEARNTGWGVYLHRRGEFFALLNETPLLGIYGDPSLAPFDDDYFFDALYDDFYASRTSVSMMTPDERAKRNADLLTLFDVYVQIGIENAEKAAAEVRGKTALDELVEFGGPKYGPVQDFLIEQGYALGSERPVEYIDAARGYYDAVGATDAASDMAFTILFVSAAALSSVVIPGSAGLLITATLSLSEVGLETVKLVEIETDESRMVEMAPVLGFDQLGPLADENADQWESVLVSAGFGLFDLTALRQIGRAARQGDELAEIGRTVQAAQPAVRRWGHLGEATVAEAFGNPNLADDAWVHFGPSSMESGVQQQGVVGFGDRSYWMRWGEVKDMNQGQLRFAIGESAASGTSDLKLMVVAPENAGIRRINGNYGLRDEGVVDGAVEGGTIYRASDEVTHAAAPAVTTTSSGLSPEDAALFREQLTDPTEFEDLEDAVQAAHGSGIPKEDIEHTLTHMRDRIAADPSYRPTGPAFKQLVSVRYAETHGYVIVLDQGRAGALEMEENLLVYTDGVEPSNVRVIGFTNRPLVQELLARAQVQRSGQLLTHGWERFENVASEILRHEDEDLLKWLALDPSEGGLYRVFTQDDLDNLRRIFPEFRPDGRGIDEGLRTLDDWNAGVGNPSHRIPRGTTPGARPARTPPASEPIFDLGRDAWMFGGTGGLAAGALFGEPAGDGEAAGGPEVPIEVYVTSTGGSTGPVMQIQILNLGKPATVRGSGVILEPVDLTPEQVADALGRSATGSGAGPVSEVLNAYCLEKAAEVPGAGQVYRVAPPETQARFGPMRLILDAAPSVFERLSPDSDPEEYYHATVQWAVWTQEAGFDQAGFEDAFLEHTKRNVEAAGQEWRPEWEGQVRAVLPNRWEDVQTVLEAAGFSP